MPTGRHTQASLTGAHGWFISAGLVSVVACALIARSIAAPSRTLLGLSVDQHLAILLFSGALTIAAVGITKRHTYRPPANTHERRNALRDTWFTVAMVSLTIIGFATALTAIDPHLTAEGYSSPGSLAQLGYSLAIPMLATAIIGHAWATSPERTPAPAPGALTP